MRTFGEILKEKRKEKDYTQPQLAKLVDRSRVQVVHWEHGTYYPSLRTVADIADVFGCTIDELIDRKNGRSLETKKTLRDELNEIRNGQKKRTFGEILRDARKAKGYTQAQLAGLLGVTQVCVYAWENGKAFPLILTAADLADLFDCSLDELMGRRVER